MSLQLLVFNLQLLILIGLGLRVLPALLHAVIEGPESLGLLLILQNDLLDFLVPGHQLSVELVQVSLQDRDLVLVGVQPRHFSLKLFVCLLQHFKLALQLLQATF